MHHANRWMLISRSAAIALLVSTFLVSSARPVAAQADVPITGRSNKKLESIDKVLSEFVTEKKVPGMAVAITKSGRLVYARGFGFADVESKTKVEPAALFRIASCSKSLTAVAILQLVERKQLSLDDKVVPLLALEPWLEPGKQVDPRLGQITIRNLLNHTGGWERDVPYDPSSGSDEMYYAMKLEPPAKASDIIRYWFGRPLKWDPGTTYSYYNFGYLVLGRVVEKVSGKPYAEYVKQEVLAPMGIRNMQVAGSFLADRAAGEVKYYESSGEMVNTIFGPDQGKPTPRCYNGSMATIDSCGGWIASAPDLVRFAAAFDFPQRCKVLKPATIEQMFTPAAVFKVPPGEETYAMGWFVRTYPSKWRNIYHPGLLKQSTTSIMVRRSDGIDYAILTNTNPPDGGDAVSTRLMNAIDKIKPTDWPNYDLFTSISPATAPTTASAKKPAMKPATKP